MPVLHLLPKYFHKILSIVYKNCHVIFQRIQSYAKVVKKPKQQNCLIRKENERIKFEFKRWCGQLYSISLAQVSPIGCCR